MDKSPDVRIAISASSDGMNTVNNAAAAGTIQPPRTAAPRVSTPPPRYDKVEKSSDVPINTQEVAKTKHGWTPDARKLVKLWAAQIAINRQKHQASADAMGGQATNMKIVAATFGSLATLLPFLNTALGANDNTVRILLDVFTGIFAAITTLISVILAILCLDSEGEKHRQTAIQYANVCNEAQTVLVEEHEENLPQATEFLRKMKDLTHLIQLFGPSLAESDDSDLPSILLLRGIRRPSGKIPQKVQPQQDDGIAGMVGMAGIFDHGDDAMDKSPAAKRKKHQDMLNTLKSDADDIDKRRKELLDEETELKNLSKKILEQAALNAGRKQSYTPQSPTNNEQASNIPGIDPQSSAAAEKKRREDAEDAVRQRRVEAEYNNRINEERNKLHAARESERERRLAERELQFAIQFAELETLRENECDRLRKIAMRENRDGTEEHNNRRAYTPRIEEERRRGILPEEQRREDSHNRVRIDNEEPVNDDSDEDEFGEVSSESDSDGIRVIAGDRISPIVRSSLRDSMMSNISGSTSKHASRRSNEEYVRIATPQQFHPSDNIAQDAHMVMAQSVAPLVIPVSSVATQPSQPSQPSIHSPVATAPTLTITDLPVSNSSSRTHSGDGGEGSGDSSDYQHTLTEIALGSGIEAAGMSLYRKISPDVILAEIKRREDSINTKKRELNSKRRNNQRMQRQIELGRRNSLNEDAYNQVSNNSPLPEVVQAGIVEPKKYPHKADSPRIGVIDRLKVALSPQKKISRRHTEGNKIPAESLNEVQSVQRQKVQAINEFYDDELSFDCMREEN